MSKATVLRYERLAGRPSTFAVWIGHPDTGSVLIGYLRLDDQVRWVARTLGSSSQTAELRGFRDRYAASVWLQKAVDGVHHRRPPGRGMRIKVLRRSRATIVAQTHGVWQGIPRLPTGRFGTQRTPPADRSRVRIGTVRCGLIERGS